MSTGGGPFISSPSVDPEVEIIVPAINHIIKDTVHTDGTPLNTTVINFEPSCSSTILEDEILPANTVLPQHDDALPLSFCETPREPASSRHHKRAPLQLQPPRTVAIEREMEARLHRLSRMNSHEDELHALRIKELEARVAVAELDRLRAEEALAHDRAMHELETEQRIKSFEDEQCWKQELHTKKVIDKDSI